MITKIADFAKEVRIRFHNRMVHQSIGQPTDFGKKIISTVQHSITISRSCLKLKIGCEL